MSSQQPSLRTDVSRDGVVADIIPDPALTYLDQYKEDWYINNRPALQAERERLGICGSGAEQ